MVPPIFVMTLIKQFFNNHPTDLDALDRGLQFGDGHFTTLRIVHNVPEHLDAHIERLVHANDVLRIHYPALTTLKARLKTLAAEVGEGVCKVIITRGNSAQGYGFDSRAEANEYIQVSSLPTPQKTLDIEVADFVLTQQPMLAGLKTLNRLEQVLLSAEKSEKGVDDLIVCTSDGTVIEAIQGNVFWRVGEQWFTPSLTTAGVNGVMRQYIIESNALANLSVKDCTATELACAEQIFICNSVRGAVPVHSFNGKVFEKNPLPKKIQRLAL